MSTRGPPPRTYLPDELVGVVSARARAARTQVARRGLYERMRRNVELNRDAQGIADELRAGRCERSWMR